MNKVLITCLILAGCTNINNMSTLDLEAETVSVRGMIRQELSTCSDINPQTLVGSSATIPASSSYLYFNGSRNMLLYRNIVEKTKYSDSFVIKFSQPACYSTGNKTREATPFDNFITINPVL